MHLANVNVQANVIFNVLPLATHQCENKKWILGRKQDNFTKIGL